MAKAKLDSFFKNLLTPELFDDYCPNGLQVEGASEVKKIVFAVSATRESAEFAAKEKAQALVVHHGLFWKFHGTKPLVGPFYHRVAPLIKNDINLFGYHLPLDAHLEIGNAASIARLIELRELTPFGNHKGAFTGVKGELSKALSGRELKSLLEQKLQHPVIHSNPLENKPIKSIGIITGGANSDWALAHRLGLDAYITGEMSEHDYHESREAGVHMFAGGHHATEKFGIISLMEKVKANFPECECIFLDSENPA